MHRAVALVLLTLAGADACALGQYTVPAYQIYVGDYNGVMMKTDSSLSTFTPYLNFASGQITDMYRRKDGTIMYVVASGSMYRVDLGTATIATLQTPNKLNMNFNAVPVVNIQRVKSYVDETYLYYMIRTTSTIWYYYILSNGNSFQLYSLSYSTTVYSDLVVLPDGTGLLILEYGGIMKTGKTGLSPMKIFGTSTAPTYEACSTTTNIGQFTGAQTGYLEKMVMSRSGLFLIVYDSFCSKLYYVTWPGCAGSILISTTARVTSLTMSADDAYVLFTYATASSPVYMLNIATLQVTSASYSFNSVANYASALTGGVNAITCVDCTSGNYCPANALSPTLCPAGFYCATTSTIAACSAGTYSSTTGATTVATCLACAAGDFCPESATVRVSCPAGFYCPNMYTVVVCSPGMYSTAVGATSAATCLTCAAGDFCVNGTRVDCPAGSYCPSTSTIFVCAIGNVCPARSTQTATCPAGSYCGNTTAATTCPAGWFCTAGSTAPAACATGSTCPAGSTAQNQCPAGSFCSSPSAAVVPCTAGQYCLAGSTKYTACPGGSYCSTSAITPCTAGQYCLAGSTQPTTCPAGSFCRNTTSISACPAGSFCIAGSTAASACAAGSTCPAGSTAQTQCPAGSYCSSPSAAVIACTSSQYCLAGSTKTTACPAGSFCSTSTITACTAGQYCLAGSTSPTTCPAGSFCSSPAGPLTACIAGQYCLAGSTQAAVCPAGSYCGTTSTLATCPLGSFCGAGSTVASACTLGAYCQSGSTAQTQCPRGQLLRKRIHHKPMLHELAEEREQGPAPGTVHRQLHVREHAR